IRNLYEKNKPQKEEQLENRLFNYKRKTNKKSPGKNTEKLITEHYTKKTTPRDTSTPNHKRFNQNITDESPSTTQDKSTQKK
ncbi:hypothetical protein Q6261_26645, partial [Klebsiella pneumoniae]|uniref:hypothetical protein n=1 Tax=Klebsiella pneumoniae TaxID=573 RepID=UPI00272EF0CE